MDLSSSSIDYVIALSSSAHSSPLTLQSDSTSTDAMPRNSNYLLPQFPFLGKTIKYWYARSIEPTTNKNKVITLFLIFFILFLIFSYICSYGLSSFTNTKHQSDPSCIQKCLFYWMNHRMNHGALTWASRFSVFIVMHTFTTRCNIKHNRNAIWEETNEQWFHWFEMEFSPFN